MSILRIILLLIEILCSLLLIGLILIQKSKSQGLGLAFGSGMGETLFGSRAGNILTKLTITFGVVFLCNTLILALVYAGAQDRSLMETEAQELGGPRPVVQRPGQNGGPSPGGAEAPPTLPASSRGQTAPEAGAEVSSAAPADGAPEAFPGVPTLPGADIDSTPETAQPAPGPGVPVDEPPDPPPRSEPSTAP